MSKLFFPLRHRECKEQQKPVGCFPQPHSAWCFALHTVRTLVDSRLPPLECPLVPWWEGSICWLWGLNWFVINFVFRETSQILPTKSINPSLEMRAVSLDLVANNPHGGGLNSLILNEIENPALCHLWPHFQGPPVSGASGGGGPGNPTGQHWARGAPALRCLSCCLEHKPLSFPWLLFTGSPKQQARCLCSPRGTRAGSAPGIRTRASSHRGASPDTRALSSGSAGDQGLPAPRPGRHRAARRLLHHVHPARGPGHTHHTPPQAGRPRPSPRGLRAGRPGTDTGRSVPAPHPKVGASAAARNPDSGRSRPAVFSPIRKVRR